MNPRIVWRSTTIALIAAVILFSQSAYAQSNRLRVEITSPAERETLYASPDTFAYSVNISGWIITANPEPSLVQVRLEILHENEVTGNLTAHASSDGSFVFAVTVNPTSLNRSKAFSSSTICRSRVIFLPSIQPTLPQVVCKLNPLQSI